VAILAPSSIPKQAKDTLSHSSKHMGGIPA